MLNHKQKLLDEYREHIERQYAAIPLWQRELAEKHLGLTKPTPTERRDGE